MTHDKHAVNIVSLEGWARPSLAVAACCQNNVVRGDGSACLRMARKQRSAASIGLRTFVGPSANAGCAAQRIERLARGLTAFFFGLRPARLRPACAVLGTADRRLHRYYVGSRRRRAGRKR